MVSQRQELLRRLEKIAREDKTIGQDTGMQLVMDIFAHYVLGMPSLILFQAQITSLIGFAFVAGMERGKRQAIMQAMLGGENEKAS